MKPVVPPHVASVETAVAARAVEEAVDEATEEGLSDVLEDDDTLTEEVDGDLTGKVDVLKTKA